MTSDVCDPVFVCVGTDGLLDRLGVESEVKRALLDSEETRSQRGRTFTISTRTSKDSREVKTRDYTNII